MNREHLLRRLAALAAQEHSLLVDEKWEEAITIQGQFDALFEQLQRSTEETPLRATELEHLIELQQLIVLNRELGLSLMAQAGEALAGIRDAGQIANYSPVSTKQRGPARYLDQSA